MIMTQSTLFARYILTLIDILAYSNCMNTRVLKLQTIEPCFDDVIEPAPLPDDEREQLGAIFKALADPTRMEIFRLISAQVQPICACQMTDRFAISQPTIAHHLKILRQANLITASKRGVWVYFAVDPRSTALLARTAIAFAGRPVAAGTIS
jgi:ArsR family transcriptional regulator